MPSDPPFVQLGRGSGAEKGLAPGRDAPQLLLVLLDDLIGKRRVEERRREGLSLVDEPPEQVGHRRAASLVRLLLLQDDPAKAGDGIGALAAAARDLHPQVSGQILSRARRAAA